MDDVFTGDAELRKLSADLSAMPVAATAAIKKAVRDTAVELKDVMREDMSESRHFKQIAPTITMGMVADTPGQIVYEIGPDKSIAVNGGYPAALAHIAYYGGANGGGNTVRDPEDAMKVVETVFWTRIAEATGGTA